MTCAPPARGTSWRAAGLAFSIGLGVAVLVALVGQALGFALFLAQGAQGSYAPYFRVSALYVELFHHVDVSVWLSGAPDERSLAIGLGVALLLVSGAALAAIAAAAGWLLRGRTGAPAAALVVALAAGYALVPFAMAFVASGTPSLPVNLTLGGRLIEIGVSSRSAFVLPLAMAAAAAAIGALSAGDDSASPGDAVAADAVSGGVRALGLGLILSVAGVLVLASLQPSFARAYGSVIAAPDSVQGRLVVAGHAVLALPNQAIWVLVPAMGACDEVAVDGNGTPFLCYWRSPTEPPVSIASEGGAVARASTFRPPSRAYLAFLLVPLFATVGGGVRAARRSTNRRAAVAAGAASGLVFAALVAAAIALSRIDVQASGGFLGVSTVRISLGPELLRGTALAAAWGIGGGALGALVALRRRDRNDQRVDDDPSER